MPERYVGKQLGRFRIDEVVGSGGFAWVYRGYDPELEIPVAIKVLKPQYAGDETFESRFRREASTAAKLRHPNIIRILAVGREADAVFFVMDFLPTSLDQRLKIMGTLPETLLIRLGMDVSAALGFAHREGVIHRDIKTDNILFDEHGNAVVADFGIARAVTGYIEQTGTNMVVGTPHYFSPEQARGLALDGRGDIYSLGVTLFRAGTGVLPFQGEDWYEIARQHVEDLPPKPRSFNPALSRGVERVILKCLEKDPAARYPTGDALHAELIQLLGRASTPDTEATVMIPTPVAGVAMQTGVEIVTDWWRRWARRPRWVAAAGALGAVAVISALALSRGKAEAAHAVAPPVAHVSDSTVASAPVTQPATHVESASAIVPQAPPPAAPAPPPVLRIVAPNDAQVRVDGKVVGHGNWSGTRFAAGDHRVVAVVHTIAGCAGATDSAIAQVPDHGEVRVKLAPHPCGTVSVDAEPNGARWDLSTVDGASVADGAIPQATPIVVPSGAYVLLVSKSYCADYRARIAVPADGTHKERVRLICGQ
ncbi:MAG TPA: serine/threonine-protein kinase [Gemmatimonadaceae bacterium]|nr:serine/threonine-protein kinase [Gemmatimonadaceae bacterium]